MTHIFDSDYYYRNFRFYDRKIPNMIYEIVIFNHRLKNIYLTMNVVYEWKEPNLLARHKSIYHLHFDLKSTMKLCMTKKVVNRFIGVVVVHALKKQQMKHKLNKLNRLNVKFVELDWKFSKHSFHLHLLLFRD